MLKQLLNSPVVQFVIGRTMGLYLRFVGATTRWTTVNKVAVERIWADRTAVIGCIWHGRFAQVHKLWSFAPGVPEAKILISQSREGAVVTQASRAVGANVIRGSAAKGKQLKGGVEAMRDMIGHLKRGGAIALTPDGPRGPRMRAGIGPVRLAQYSGAPLYPIAWSTQHRLVMGSWDRFILPLPFGRGALVWGEPIFVARTADATELETARLTLETELNRISAQADTLVGVPVIDPAPPRAAPAPTPEPAAQTT